MAKNIILCTDGTWNGPGKDVDGDPVPTLPSNVLKLYHWLSGRDSIASTSYAGEAERSLFDSDGNLLQISKYLDGVGDDANALVKLLGGVFGAGLVTRIVRGYTFISRNYVPGDRIFLVGFSRGAYTARALAGLILSQGLLDARKINLDDKEQAYKLGCALWNQKQKDDDRINKVEFIHRLEKTIYDLPGFFSSPPQASMLIEDVEIQAIGVWDTVGALGIPQYENEDQRLDVFRFADLALNERVEYGFHAISLDEQRTDFTPTLWDVRTNLTQWLSPGAHADVGGSYPTGIESGLSDRALFAMQKYLAELPGGNAALFGAPPHDANPDVLGDAHQPWISSPYKEMPAERRQSRLFNTEQGLLKDTYIDQRKAGRAVKAYPSKSPEKYTPENIPM